MEDFIRIIPKENFISILGLSFTMLIEILIIILILLVLYSLYLHKSSEKKESDIKPLIDLNKEVVALKTQFGERTKAQDKLDKERANREENIVREIKEFMRFTAGTRGGSVAENILKQMLITFIKTHQVVTNLRVDGKVVEFAWVLGGGKYIPIDSKFPQLIKLYKIYEKSEDIKKQKDIKKRVKNTIKKYTEDVKKYANKSNTIDKCIMALPSGIFDIFPELSSEYLNENLIVIPYELVALYCFLLHRKYIESQELGEIGDYREIIEKLFSIIKQINKRTNNIDRGIKLIDNANQQIKTATIHSENYGIRAKRKMRVKVKAK